MDALATVTYAGTKKNLVESGMVADTPAVAAPSAEGEAWKVKVTQISQITQIIVTSDALGFAACYRWDARIARKSPQDEIICVI